jgi:putative spermidine/putrescine transport system ATP-binding protein
MRFELRELVKRLGLTAIYVTHDQEDAFALCDRIAVMTSGRILQVGTPQQIYEQPTAVAVARFLGKNNLIPVMRVSSMKSTAGAFKTIDGGHILNLSVNRSGLAPLDRPCVLAIRPENVRITPNDCITPATENCFIGEVVDVRFAGGTLGVHITAGGLGLEASALEQGPFRVGSRCCVFLPPEHLRLLNE